MRHDVPTALADLARVFAAARVRWYVFGAQAVIGAGVIRTTLDIDVTVEVPPAGPAALLAALERGGFAMRDVGDPATFIAETRVIPVRHTARGVPVDVVLAGPGLEESMMTRVVIREVNGVQIPFIDTADLVALKMLAGRRKDLDDVRSLIRAQPRDLSIAVARQRTVELSAMVDDSTLVSTLDRIIDDECATPEPPKAAKPKAAKPRTPRAKAPVKRATGRRDRASRRPRRR